MACHGTAGFQTVKFTEDPSVMDLESLYWYSNTFVKEFFIQSSWRLEHVQEAVAKLDNKHTFNAI